MSTKTKPYYKTWQFWVIVVALVIVVATAVGIGISANTGRGEFGMAAVVPIDESLLHKVGEAAEFSDGKMTVTSVERNYQSETDFFVPEDGNEFLKVTVTLENTSDEPLSYNALYWEILGASDETQGPAGITYSADGAIDRGELAPGESVTGDVYFEAPKGRSGMVVQYTPSITDNEVVYVKL